MPCLHYMVLKPYFDIKTEDIKQRLQASLNPFNRKFLDLYKEKPDLYGPFWILSTLVVVFTISGNLARYESMGEENFTINLKIVPKAFGILFAAASLVPFGITMAVKFLGTGSEIHLLYVSTICAVTQFVGDGRIQLFILEFLDFRLALLYNPSEPHPMDAPARLNDSVAGFSVADIPARLFRAPGKCKEVAGHRRRLRGSVRHTLPH